MTGPLGFPLVQHGDPEAAVVDILQDSSIVTTLVDANNISISLDGYNVSSTTQRWVMVTLEGGWRDKIRAYKPRVDIETYGETRAVAYDICEACFSTMMCAFGYRGNGLFLCDVRSEMGPTRIPDKLTDNYRYVCSLRLTVTPDD